MDAASPHASHHAHPTARRLVPVAIGSLAVLLLVLLVVAVMAIAPEVTAAPGTMAPIRWTGISA